MKTLIVVAFVAAGLMLVATRHHPHDGTAKQEVIDWTTNDKQTKAPGGSAAAEVEYWTK